MGQLACEICGNTNIVKQGDSFVCQGCGMQYSADALKKMLSGESAPETVEAPVSVAAPAPNAAAVQAAVVDNLMQLAISSYESKNYAQAENFCNQVIANDANHYDAWKLKGEAINFQITVDNDRIDEVYNCIMTSYKILDEEGQEEHREEILESLRICLEGEITFCLDQLKSKRPSDAMLTKVKDSFISCANKAISSHKELGYDEDTVDAYRDYIKNLFTKKVNEICESTWDDVVYYNYYRKGFTDDSRPDNDILTTYINEGDNLIELLKFATKYFNKSTSAVVKRKNYILQNFMHRKLYNACSYKRMVSTTTNGYGAVISRREYWEVDRSLTASAKEARNREINKTCQMSDQLAEEAAKEDPTIRKELIATYKKSIEESTYTGPIVGAGNVFGFVLLMGMAYLFFFKFVEWFEGMDLFWQILGGVSAFIAICILWYNISQNLNAKRIADAECERLQNVIDKMQSNS